MPCCGDMGGVLTLGLGTEGRDENSSRCLLVLANQRLGGKGIQSAGQGGARNQECF